MTESEIKALVEKILAVQQPPKQWGTAEHVALVSNVAQHIMLDMEPLVDSASDADENRARKLLLRKTLLFKGLGGNSSQFRQWLAAEGLITAKTDALAAQYD